MSKVNSVEVKKVKNVVTKKVKNVSTKNKENKISAPDLSVPMILAREALAVL